MKTYTEDKKMTIVADDMMLTKDMPTTAGSKMLDGYMSLFDSEALTRLKGAGYTVAAKAAVGEFAIDLLGETNFKGATASDGYLKNQASEMILSGEVSGAVCLDVNGAVRRAAAQSGLVSVKPTYGTVSRFGTIPAACSGETVSVLACDAEDCGRILDIIKGHDDKDGTSLRAEDIARTEEATPVRKVAVLTSMKKGINADVSEKLDGAIASLKNGGVEVEDIDDSIISASRPAWNALMSAELCNNVSRYDGVKYGYRAESFTNIDELYTNSRTEAFGELLKTAIIFGSETLSTENYMKIYDKCLRVRRVISEAFGKLFEKYDAVLMPATSSMSYIEAEVKENKFIAFEENYYTAPASITGLPAVVAGGVQLVGRAFSEKALLEVIKVYEKEGK